MHEEARSAAHLYPVIRAPYLCDPCSFLNDAPSAAVGSTMTPQRAQAEQPSAQQRKRRGFRNAGWWNWGKVRIEPNMLVIHDGGDAILGRALKHLAVGAAVAEADRCR